MKNKDNLVLLLAIIIAFTVLLAIEFIYLAPKTNDIVPLLLIGIIIFLPVFGHSAIFLGFCFSHKNKPEYNKPVLLSYLIALIVAFFVEYFYVYTNDADFVEMFLIFGVFFHIPLLLSLGIMIFFVNYYKNKS